MISRDVSWPKSVEVILKNCEILEGLTSLNVNVTCAYFIVDDLALTHDTFCNLVIVTLLD